MPAVSVIILTKNRCELLKKALLSVELQKNVETEIIVVNDGSTDDTMEVLNAWHKPLVVINHNVSLGIVHSRQEAVTKAGGEFIAFLDDDDEWIDENKLSQQLNWLESSASNILIGTGMILVDESGKNLGTVFRPKLHADIYKTMLFRNNFFTSSIVVRKSALLKVGGFIVDGRDYAEDYDLWLRLGKQGIMHNIYKPMVKYLVKNSNGLSYKLKFWLKQRDLIQVHKKDYPNFLFADLVLTLRIIYARVREIF
jgi:glycosyltransferase involved in cell wall biosynthesis